MPGPGLSFFSKQAFASESFFPFLSLSLSNYLFIFLLKVLAGIYPIAQLQEPYSSIRYISERIPVTQILKIKHPMIEDATTESKPVEWSPLDICEGNFVSISLALVFLIILILILNEAWAIKRGYFTSKAARPDVYRAANELLRMALDGRLCLSLKPKNYYKEREMWSQDPETKELDKVVRNVEETAKEKLAMGSDGLSREEDEDEEEEESEYETQFRNQEQDLEEDEEKDASSSEADAKPRPSHVRLNPFALLIDEQWTFFSLLMLSIQLSFYIITGK